MRTASPRAVRILGDVGELQEVRERADHAQRRIRRQVVEQVVQSGPVFGVSFAREAHGGLAHGLHQLERRCPLLCAHGIAEQAAEQADVFAEGEVLVGRRHGHAANYAF